MAGAPTQQGLLFKTLTTSFLYPVSRILFLQDTPVSQLLAPTVCALTKYEAIESMFTLLSYIVTLRLTVNLD